MKSYDFYLLITAILISILLHMPLVPHETGSDSFLIHRAADSIIYYHQIKWLINPFSLTGYYPYSYPSGVITLLAEISSLAGIPMEYTILLFTWIEGVLAVFFSFYLGKKIISNPWGKWILVFVVAFSPGLIYFSLWTVSTRGFLSILFILIIYLLLETKNFRLSMRGRKFVILFLIFLLILPTIHRLWIFTLPLIITYPIFRIFSPKLHITNPKIYYLIPLITFIIILVSFQVISFFYEELWRHFNIYNINDPLTYYRLGLLYGRLNGPLIFLLPLGIYYLLKYKTEWNLYFIMYIIILLPFYYIGTYISVISYIIFPIIIAYGLIEFMKVKKREERKIIKRKRRINIHKVRDWTIITLLIINLLFAGFVQYYHPNLTGKKTYDKFYMEEGTYAAGIWLKYSWHPNQRDNIITNYDYNRILAISQDESIEDSGIFELIDNFTTIKRGDVTINPTFWSWPDVGIFTLKKPYNTAYKYWYALVAHTPNDGWSQSVQRKFNISIVAEYKEVKGYQMWSPYIGEPIKKSKFFENIPLTNYVIFENDKYEIYYWEQKGG